MTAYFIDTWNYLLAPFGVEGYAVGWCTMLQAGRSLFRLWTVSGRIFHLHNLFGRNISMGSTQHLTEMIINNISWGIKWKVFRFDNLSVFTCRFYLKSGSFNRLEISGSLLACSGLALHFTTDFWIKFSFILIL
jgi:hypothetical protein